MSIHRYVFINLVVAMAVMVIVSASASVSTAASPDHISIACSKDLAPFHFSDDSGQPAGIMVDTWRLWSEKTGIAVDFQIADWNETLTMVGSGKADVHAGLFYNKERDKFLDYGLEFMKMETHSFWHVSLPSIKEIDDLAPYRVGVISGDYVEGYLKERLPEGNVVPFANYHAMMNALQKGTLKVFAADTLPALFYLDKNGLLSSFTFASEKPLYKNSLFFAVKEGNQALIETIHQGMALITDEEKRDINRRWVTTGDGKGDAVIISIDRSYEPFTFVNALGQPSGLFVDMWRLWSEKTGRKIQFRASGWTETLEGLRAGEADIHSGLSFSEERSEWIDFSTKIYETYTSVYQRAGDKKPASIDDYEKDIVGTQFGTYQDVEFKKAYPNLNVRNYGSNQALIDALLKGEIKAIVQEEVFMDADIDRLGLHGDITAALTERLFPSTIHAGVLKGNAELLDEINNGFAAIDRNKLADLEQRWVHNLKYHFYKPETVSLVLSPEEKSWLGEHPVLRIAPDPDFIPIEFFDEQGKYQGMVADFMNLVADRLGVRLKAIHKENWPQAIEALRSGEADLIGANVPTDEFRKDFLFTESYFGLLDAIITHADIKGKVRLQDLAGKEVLVVEGWPQVHILKDQHPEITVVETENTLDALLKVASKEYDYVFTTYPVASYLIQENGLTGLRVAGTGDEVPPVSVMVRKDSEMLRNLIDKALATITEKERRAIKQHWVPGLSALESSLIKRVKLNNDEQAFLAAHSVIRVAMDSGWAPVEFTDNQGRFHGISMDYLTQLSGLLGVQFEVAEGLSWQEVVAAVDKGDLDMFSSVARTPERKARYHFTNPYLSMPVNIFAGEDVTYIGNLDALKEKQIAVVEGYAIHEWLQTQHPGIKLVPVKSVPVALKMVAAGQAYAFVGNVVTASYYIGKLRLNQIRVVGETPYKYDQCMAVRQDLPMLAVILQKGLDAISQSERELIFNRWVSIQYEHGFDYSLLWKILVPACLVILLVFYWNQRLRIEVVQRKQAEAELKTDEERLEALLKLSQMKHVDEEQLMEYALEECVRLTSSEVGYLHFVNPDQKTLSLYTWSKNTHDYCTAEKSPHYPIEAAGIWADCVRDRKPAVHNDYPNHSDRKDLPDGHVPLNRHMSIPVMDGDKVVMVAGVGNKRDPYIDSDIRQISLFTQNMWGIIKEKRVEEKLQFTQFAVDRASDAAFWIDPDAQITYVNDAACRSLGYTQKELMTMTINDLDPNNPREKWPELWRGLKEQQSMTMESTHQAKDGRTFPVEITANFVAFGGNEFVCAFARDVTQRKREEEIRTRYEFVVNAVKDPMSFINKNYAYEAVNETFLDIFQETRRGILGKTVAEVWGNRIFEKNIQPKIDRCLAGEVVSYEAVVDLKKSGHRHCQITMYPYFNEEKKVTHAAVVTKDIEDRIQADRATKESEERIKTVLDSINTGIIIIDPEDRTIVDANPTAEQMIGLPKEEIVGNLCHKFICPRAMNDCPIIDHDQTVDNSDRIMLNAAGQEIPILKTVVKVKLGGKPHFVESFVDLTERKQAEEELQRNLEELERFNEVTVDREEKMIDLKSEINQLMKQLGKEEKYKIVE